MSDMTPLTRGDVERLADVLLQYIHEDYAEQLLSHDAAMREQLADAIDEREGAYMRVDGLQVAIKDLTARLAEADETMKSAWESLGERTKRIEALKAKLDEVEQERDEHVALVTEQARAQERSYWKQQLTAKDAEIADEREIKARVRMELSAMERQASVWRTERDRAYQRMAAKDAEIADWRTKFQHAMEGK
jgi:chromosome segregation ATPase